MAENIVGKRKKKLAKKRSVYKAQISPYSADPDIFLGGWGVGGGCPTENALVLLYDTLISRFQWMKAFYKKSQRFQF